MLSGVSGVNADSKSSVHTSEDNKRTLTIIKSKGKYGGIIGDKINVKVFKNMSRNWLEQEA